MTVDLDAIRRDTGPLGVRVYLDLAHTHERTGEAPVVVMLGLSDRLRVSVHEVRQAIRRLVLVGAVRRMTNTTGPVRYELLMGAP